MISLEEIGKQFYSADEVFKDVKDNPGLIIAKGENSCGIKANKDYLLKGSEYYITYDAANKLLKPYAKTLEGMIALRKLKEMATENKTTNGPKTSKSAKTFSKDYGKRLTGISQYKLGYHAKQRMKKRFGLHTDKECETWFANLAPRLGFIGTEFGDDKEVWGNSEATFIVDPKDKMLITVMSPDMDINISKADFPDLDGKISEAIHKIVLATDRKYWEELAVKYKALADFSALASKAIDKTRKAKSVAGLCQIRDTVKSATYQYQELTFDINELNAYHNEALKYLKEKDPEQAEK